MTNTCVIMKCKDWISTVTIDNPPDNYLDKDVLSGLNKTVSEMISSRTELRVVLLMAQGKNFSAGIDYTRFVKMTKEEAGHFAEVGYNLLKHIENLPVPVIAAVKGETSGAGLGLALAADIRIASSDAVFSFPRRSSGCRRSSVRLRGCTRPWELAGPKSFSSPAGPWTLKRRTGSGL
jgi:enoyl-CoA hydratase/carnithine racemase